jgi:flagellum-specific ATP synthase
VALAIAEHFRDRGNDVLLMMDSITRVAMAQREIGLAVGEPPTTRGYTPSVFAELPRLLERAGPADSGSITGIFTVLVEGDDMNEPVSDAVRGTVDGHIVLSRDLAQANHYPAIDVLQSVSRLMGRVASPEHQRAAEEARQLLASYRQVEDLVNVGAYERGSDPETDRAIEAHPRLVSFLQQGTNEMPERPPAQHLQELLGTL